MSKLQLILLGRFECLLSSGTRISLPMRKAEVLLAYLALTPGLRHPRERLINLLWSDRGEEQARNSLRQCLSAIRKSLGNVADLALQVDRSTVSLQPGLIEVDVLEFERLADIGDYESLTTAADLYQGEFLEGIAIRDAACQEWLDSERSRFKRQLIEILLNLAETQLISHDFGHAIKSAERLVKQDPLGEAGWRLLMRSYFEKGDRAHALQAFKRCQQALREELEVEPETATIELRDQIAGGETSPKPTSTPPARKSPVASTAPTDYNIAVLPFDNLSGDPEQEYFSDGITDSIILNLSLFPGLNVKSRNSSFAFKQQIKSLGEISKELGVDYIVEGNIRRSEQHVRITVQLIEAEGGNQIWGKRYDAKLTDLFTLEEDLSRAIAATVTGQIESELQRVAIAKGAAGQESYDLLLSGIYHNYRFNRQDTVIAIEKLDQCLALDPNNVRAHKQLYTCHLMNYLERWTEDYRASFELAAEHIKKALALAPESAMVLIFYAQYLVFRGEFEQAAPYLDRALAINPNDPHLLATQALNLEIQGEAETALQAAERACLLDPYHPWAEWEVAVSQYISGQYESALETISKSRTSPGFIQIFGIASSVKLGKTDIARQALQAFLRECSENMLSMPTTQEEWLQYTRENYPFKDPRINHDLIECLVRAGLEEEISPRSIAAGASDLPSILVLPFANLSGDPDQEYFSDGITESIILYLGSFSDLRVKSQHASFAFKDSARSVEEIAHELGAQYIVEGSVRRFGDHVRITVQLDDVASGDQLWGKRFDSSLENLLDLEEELSLKIAGTASGRISHKRRQSALQKPAKDLQSYDYFMRGCHYIEFFTAKNIGIAIDQFEKCLALDPDNARAHSMLGMAHILGTSENLVGDRKRSLELAGKYIARAIDLSPEDASVHAFMAEYLFLNKDFDLGLVHARKSVELNPTLADGYSMLAWHAGSTRQFDKALEYVKISMKIDQHHPYAGWNAGEIYRVTENFERAIESFRSMSHMSSSVHAQVAACFAGLERIDEANAEMRQFLELAREQMFSVPASRDEWYRFWDETMPYKYRDDTDRFFDLLLKAGLCDQDTLVSVDIPSIAVLPFENMSGDSEQEHFSDGITADIIDTLSRFNHMRTVSRYSTLPYKREKPPIAEIAAQQGVRYILDGSVRKSGDRIRVNAELIDSNNEQILWSKRFDRDLDDLFSVQDELTQNITLAMKVQLDDGEMARLRSKGTSDTRAWELIMTAVDLQDTYIRQNILDARTMAEEAISLDPEYPYASISLGWTHVQEAYSGWSQSIEVSNLKAEQANRRARALDPDYAEVWSQMGMIHLMRHEAEEAIEDCLRAVELEPGSAEIQGLTAFTYVFAGDYEHAKNYNQNMVRLSPVRANWNYLIEGQIEVAYGNLDRAAEVYRQGLEVEPESPLCRYFLIDLMLQKGDEISAKKYAEEIRALDKSVTARGIAHTYSADPALREAFRARLAQYNLA